MRLIGLALVLTLSLVVALLAAGAQQPGKVVLGAQEAPYWAYGFLKPAAPGEAAPPCRDATPVSCNRLAPPVADDGVLRRAPGSSASFTLPQIGFGYGPADWFPEDHPPMPEIVARGREKDGVRACALCHYHNGKGKMENAGVAGLPVNYFMQAMAAFASGARQSADPRKHNTHEMIAIAKALTSAEMRAAAEYFGSIKWTPWIKVIEADNVPKFHATAAGLFISEKGAGMEPLRQRVIEMPENTEQTEVFRNPRSGFVAYVPVGSMTKGEVLATTGGATVVAGKIMSGPTIACAICHGPDLKGIGDVPGIAGRSPSYIVRQLYDMQQGTRKTDLMKSAVANLSNEDMVALAAYAASRVQ
jgi:cytochrome c553